MFNRFKPAVFNFLHTVLGIKITTPWDPTVLPPLSEPILTYCQRLAAMKKGDGITQLKKWQVQRARAYKAKTGLRREYVSAIVVNSHSNKTTYVAIERRRGDLQPLPFSDHTDIDPQLLPREFSSSNSSLSISSAPDSDFIYPTGHADDIIAPMPPSGKWDKSDELVSELIFEKPVYLYELAILALIVHEVNTSYLLMTNDYYHYAGTIMKMLEEEYDAVDVAEGAEAGKWCGLVFYRKQGNISLHGSFKEAIKKFVSFVPMLSN
jgi:hypothetical protein